jgi:hypothetical protein
MDKVKINTCLKVALHFFSYPVQPFSQQQEIIICMKHDWINIYKEIILL